MNQTSLSPRRGQVTRALVLAGGGAAGNAWQVGLVAGLAARGVNVTRADLVIGTSAGATAAAMLTSGIPLAELYDAVVAESSRPRPASPGRGMPGPRPSGGRPSDGGMPDGRPPNDSPPGPRPPVMSGPDYLAWSDAIIRSSADAADMRRRLGAAALDLDLTDGVAGSRWRRIVAARLPNLDWPEQTVLITAVDARTGEPVVFDRRSGVDLVDAVAASTSAMTPYRIGDTAYLNGGYRRSENADLATGWDRVLVLSPFGGRSRMPSGWGMDLATQVAELRAAGSTVETLFPDEGAGAVFDANALDPSTRVQAARGGHSQGRALAAAIGAFWA